MSNNHGFTLVELMGILVVLAIILLIAIPAITGMLRNQRENQIVQYEEQVCTAAITYINLGRENPENVSVIANNPAGSSVTITVDRLIEDGSLASSISHPEHGNNAGISVIVTGSPDGPVCSFP